MKDKPLALGRTAEVYDWGGDRVLKLYFDWCPPHWVENESKVARAVVAAHIPTPAALEIIEVDGRRGIVYERVTGISMLQDMNARPWTSLRHARSLAELQAKINMLSVPGLFPYKDGLMNAIRSAPHLSADLRASVLDLLPALPEGDRLCHGDFHPGNVMLTGNGPVVIDWMAACIGNPWADFTRTSLLLTIGPKGAGKQLSPIVRLVIDLFHLVYVRRYLELLPDPQNERRKWRPVIAAARLNEHIEPECDALIRMVQAGLKP
jgi:hypothetical protein